MSFCPITHASFCLFFCCCCCCMRYQNVLKTPVIVLAPPNCPSNPLWHQRASHVAPRLPQGHHLTQVSMPNLARCAALKPFCIFLIFVYGLLSRSLPLLAWTAASVTTTPPPPPTPRLLPPNWGGLKTNSSLLPVRFSSAGGTRRWPDEQPLLGTVWIIYLLNLARAWHFDVWRPEAPTLTI